jgi:hypothetical protein
MFHRWAALVLVLALWAMTPKNAAGQDKTQPRGHGAGKLGKSYPNPFNPENHTPFTVGDSSTCADVGEQHEVTIQIKNVLAQVVAIPVLEGVTSAVSSSALSLGGRTPISRLKLTCGDYIAFWDGNVQGTKKEAASGIYLVVITIDGKFAGSTRIFNRK